MYSILDAFTVINVIGLVIVFSEYTLSEEEIDKTQIVLLTFYIVNLCLIPFPSMYAFGSERRFMGIFYSCNLSVSVMTLCGVAIWEIEKYKYKKPRLKVLLLNLIGFGILIVATRTRTVLFLLPYWLWECSQIFNKKYFIWTLILLGLTISPALFNSLNERMSLEGGDASSMTRALLYLALIKGILGNYIIIPHGSNAAFFFIKQFTGDDGFSAHNDVLRYLYDWGGYFIIFLIYLIRTMRKYCVFNFEMILIFLGFSALLLHNMLFLPITWIPLCLIMNIRELRFPVKKYRHGEKGIC
ncbi:MAG: hypothetical protein K2J15_01510 [Muribaculaceae bacterium]|nr:hypothetical protein [Muribaculaceae bacterium]